MTNRPKAIGTACESAVVRVLKASGWPNAERRALEGTQDRGDVTGCPGLVIEVKGGHAAEDASDGQVVKWLEETERERARDNAAYGILVMKRKAIGHDNAGRWWAVMWSDAFAHLLAEGLPPGVTGAAFPVRFTLDDVIEALRGAGWGDPL